MATQLITLAELKTWLSITDSSQDDILNAILPAVYEVIEDYCETSFAEQTVTNEVHDCSRADTIGVEGWPITSVQAVRLNCAADGTGGATIPVTEYVVREEEIVLRTTSLPKGRGLVAVDYKYGFTAVPEKVKLAAKITSEGYYRMNARKSVGITSKSKEGESINFAKSWTGGGEPGSKGAGIPIEAIGLLQEYRDIGWPSRVEMATGRR